MKRKSRLNPAQWHQLKVALDTVRNPDKALLGGPSVKEAKEIIARLTGVKEEDQRPFSSLQESHGN
jgi:hypothetical protein